MECRCCCMHSIFCKQKHGAYVEDMIRKKIYNKNIHIKLYGAVDIAECLIQTNFLKFTPQVHIAIRATF